MISSVVYWFRGYDSLGTCMDFLSAYLDSFSSNMGFLGGNMDFSVATVAGAYMGFLGDCLILLGGYSVM